MLAVVKPNKPISSSTLARWLKSLLANTGNDTAIIKAHSVRGATASAAANTGVTTSDILKAADWCSLSFITSQFNLVHMEQQCSPIEGQSHYKLPQLIWRLSLLKYDYRMAQHTKWMPAILDYTKKERLNISTSHTHPPLYVCRLLGQSHLIGEYLIHTRWERAMRSAQVKFTIKKG